MKPTALIIEDGPAGLGWTVLLEEWGYEVKWARTLDEGSRFFRENPKDWALVIVDGCVDSGEYDSHELLVEISASYDGPRIAASDKAEVRKLQMAAGCTLEAKDKNHVFGLLMEIIGADLQKVA